MELFWEERGVVCTAVLEHNRIRPAFERGVGDKGKPMYSTLILIDTSYHPRILSTMVPQPIDLVDFLE